MWSAGSEIRCAKVQARLISAVSAGGAIPGGRRVRNTAVRAMEKGSKFGRKQQEDAWHNAEVDALYRLADAGVRVPKPLRLL